MGTVQRVQWAVYIYIQAVCVRGRGYGGNMFQQGRSLRQCATPKRLSLN